MAGLAPRPAGLASFLGETYFKDKWNTLEMFEIWRKIRQQNIRLFFTLPVFQDNNITEVNTDTFCKSDNSYYLRLSLSEVRMDGNPVVLSKYPDSFTCMKVLPVGRYRWGEPMSQRLTLRPLQQNGSGSVSVVTLTSSDGSSSARFPSWL